MKSPAILLAAILLTLGCERHEHGDHEQDEKPPAEHSHAKQGPHGGAVLEAGDDIVHVEFVHDPKAKSIRLYLIDDQLKPLAKIDQPPMLNLIAGNEPRQIQLTPIAGESNGFQASDPALAGEEFVAQINLFANGKSLTTELGGEHDHGHEH